VHMNATGWSAILKNRCNPKAVATCLSYQRQISLLSPVASALLRISRGTPSFVERQNLTMRMGMRRFTRLTNAFSKKIENLSHAVALRFMFYNFGRIHQTLRVTPAMQSGLTDHVWTLEEIAALADSAAGKQQSALVAQIAVDLRD
jgi:hypothetical protein